MTTTPRAADPTAAASEAGSCTGNHAAAEPLEVDERYGAALYDPEQTGALPDEAVLASLGCGNPTAVADLHSGERVLDLGSGGGIDVLLSARRVGPAGFAYGVDMTTEMLQLARANAAKASATNVEFLQGTIEDIPLPDASVDVVISNCVINLSVDKPAVLREMLRVLVPGGRIGISDVVAEDQLTAADRAARGTYVGCIAGALSRSEYLVGLAEAGFVDADVEFTHGVAPGLHGGSFAPPNPTSAPLPPTPPTRASPRRPAALPAATTPRLGGPPGEQLRLGRAPYRLRPPRADGVNGLRWGSAADPSTAAAVVSESFDDRSGTGASSKVCGGDRNR
jgi:SAM-dependent methyltransferase